MPHGRISMLSVLAFALSVDGQITTSLHLRPDAMDEVKIRNDSATDLVAFVVTAKQAAWNVHSSTAFVVYSDPLVDSSDKPLPPKEERVVMMRGKAPGTNRSRKGHWSPGAKPLLEEPITAAGIFEDGTQTGDEALLNRLMVRRSNMLLAVETALETLADAGRRNVPRDLLIQQFQKMANSVSRWYLPPEQQVGRRLYQSIVGKLVNLPEVQLGSPFPPTAFVEQETAALSQQRVKLSEAVPKWEDAVQVAK